MTTFIALYRGPTIGDARLVAVSADPGLVAEVAGRMLCEPQHRPADPVHARIAAGRQAALRLIEQGAADEPA